MRIICRALGSEIIQCLVCNNIVPHSASSILTYEQEEQRLKLKAARVCETPSETRSFVRGTG